MYQTERSIQPPRPCGVLLDLVDLKFLAKIEGQTCDDECSDDDEAHDDGWLMLMSLLKQNCCDLRLTFCVYTKTTVVPGSKIHP